MNPNSSVKSINRCIKWTNWTKVVRKCRARMTAHHTLKSNSQSKTTDCRKYHPTNYRQKKRELTGSLVFDEKQLEALLESVLIHIELYLHPKRRMKRWAETGRDKEGAGKEKRGDAGGRCRRTRRHFKQSSRRTEKSTQVVGREQRWRDNKCTIEKIGNRRGDNDYLNTEKHGNKTLCRAVLKTNGFRRKWCSCLSACP